MEGCGCMQERSTNMSDELVLWDGVDDNGQYDIYQVSEDEN